MALQKQPVAINFSSGVNTLDDSNQVPVGQFLTLQNSVFTNRGALTKRNGFGLLTTLPNTIQTNLTTLNGNLTATGSSLYAYSQDTSQWLDQGVIQPINLDVLPLIRVSTSQTAPDTAVAASGLVCLVYVDGGLAYYQVSDSTTGQQIVQRQALPATATNPRVFLLGNYFVITFIATVASASHLQYVAVPTSTPSSPTTAADFPPATNVSSLTAGYDGFVYNNNLYLGWSATSTTVKIAYLTSLLIASPATSLASHTASVLSVTADTTSATIWLTFWDSGSTNGYSVPFNYLLVQLNAAIQILTGVSGLVGLTSEATAGVCRSFYDQNHNYASPYPASVRTDTVYKVKTTQTGTVTGPTVVLRGCGLASKPFITASGTVYMLIAYGQKNQPSYFLIDSDGNVYMRLAYSNGGGFASSQVLATVSVLGSTYMVPYLIADFLTTVNKATNNPSGTPTSAVYTQTGVNLAQFQINESSQYSSEIAGALHLTGGQLWEYDGVRPVEHGFQVWPEDIAGSYNTTVSQTPTGTFASGSNQVTLSSVAGIYVGMSIQDMTHTGYIPTGTTITAISGSIVTISQPTTSAGTSDSLLIQGNQVAQPSGYVAGQPPYYYQFCYEWTDNQGNLHRSAPSIPLPVSTAGSGTNGGTTLYVPTLRQTYKIAPNPVRIVGYRWSVAQQVYYQFTSVTNPYINDPTVDFITITDVLNDAQILGNAIIYTTGGVVEDIAAPASIASCLFKNRLFLVDAEDQNLLWFSKQVIEAVPVEMSDLLTIYVAPTSGAQGSTGPVTALSAMDDKLIIFKRDAIYYITGTGPDNTGANSDFSDPVYITSSVGCSNPNSIVLMPNGLMFQSDKGIWLLGRDLSTNYIGAPVQAYNSDTVDSAIAIPGTNQVRFILNNRLTLMYDYFMQQWGVFTNLSAISSTLYQGLHTYLNSYGQVFQETPGAYLDGSSPVLMNFTTGWISAAGLQGFERFYFLNLLGTYATPFTLNVSMSYDYNPSAVQSVIVTPSNFTPAWGGDSNWGSNPYWGGTGNVFQARVFPSQQKCETFQISITEQYDPTYGVPAGQGLSLSGLAMVIGVKKGYRTQSAARSFG